MLLEPELICDLQVRHSNLILPITCRLIFRSVLMANKLSNYHEVIKTFLTIPSYLKRCRRARFRITNLIFSYKILSI